MYSAGALNYIYNVCPLSRYVIDHGQVVPSTTILTWKRILGIPPGFLRDTDHSDSDTWRKETQ
jgi:hypothetical protein